MQLKPPTIGSLQHRSAQALPDCENVPNGCPIVFSMQPIELTLEAQLSGRSVAR